MTTKEAMNRDPLMNEMWSPDDIGGSDIRKDFISRCHLMVKDGGFLIFPFAVKQNNYKPEPFFSPKALFDWFYSKLTQSKEEAVKEEREICRQIFIDEVDWAEWSMSEIDAGKEFDEARASLTKTEGKE